MKKLFVVSLVILTLLLSVFVQGSLAYSQATGCVVDGKTGQPWTHGGTVYLEDAAGNPLPPPPATQYTTNLDANGCFTAQLWQPGNNPPVQFRIVLNPGPNGQPSDLLCPVPADTTTDTYDCGTLVTDTGPNAVALINMNAASPGFTSALWTAALFTMAGLAGAFVLMRIRRRQMI